ncbi:molecular chaperone HtpG [Methanomethylophilus alvi]|jgi:molecular chaperone HtpG|uniref:molecular chaperone HtpG n=1 Tax=Methanomethylophilus alvi TaxID=1291540 RepID=UPI000336556F|nr:molecular chaperone HtpG [Methanomethylophilus alvi]MDD7480248.1 molecular chaperone HtpG [Methanomethylophilus alvi]MDY7060781.1 molecular chaperone HtpG [Methanomethylophilus alvi]CDF30220.1 chaperone protein HtpG [Methanoculleus sp. CAG:1088]
MAKRQFKTESKRILDMMVNSIYTHKEIFLRELISNASDAIDKLNYKVLTESDSKVGKDDFRIDVKIDRDAKTVTVSDNGIGMTADEMEKNLGYIAHSGTLEFKKEIDDKENESIGQFGVGFYSAFMVADDVKVVSKAYGSEEANIWESDGVDGYTIKECQKDGFGTDIILHIKDDQGSEEYSEFLETERLRELVEKYSDYIRWPIHMTVDESEWKETGEKDEKGEPKKDYVTTKVDKVVNSMVPIWKKSKKEADDDKCKEFYKDKFHDYEDPVSVIRVSAEGAVTYKALLFIPSKAPYDFYTRDFQPGLQLYSNGVLIMDKCADLLPYCFRFVRGVVDSPDFSLNISREVLQHDSQLKAVGTNLTKQVKKELEKLMKDDAEKYAGFYESFGRQLKYGVVDQYGKDADLLKDLIMFHSVKQDKQISLAQYVKDMPEDQKKIYYVTAETAAHAKDLPQVEPVLAKGYDVLAFTDDIDTFVTNVLREYDKKEFCNATTEDLGLETEEEKKEAEKKDEEYKDLIAFAKESLGEEVADVKISHKLKNHAVLLTTQGNITFEVERYFKEMPGQAGTGVKAARVLELNSDSDVFKSLDAAFKDDKERAKKIVKVMYGQACLMAGQPIDNPVEYSDLVLSML